MELLRKLVLSIATIVAISTLVGQYRRSPELDRAPDQSALSNSEAYRQDIRQGWWDGLRNLFQSWQSSQQSLRWSADRNRRGFEIGYRRGYEQGYRRNEPAIAPWEQTSNKWKESTK